MLLDLSAAFDTSDLVLLDLSAAFDSVVWPGSVKVLEQRTALAISAWPVPLSTGILCLLPYYRG